MDKTLLRFIIVALICTWLPIKTSASFIYGQPCSPRNTAYLYSMSWLQPLNHTANCLDITGYRKPNPNVDIRGFLKNVSEVDTLYADHMNLSRFPVSIVRALPNLETIDMSGNDLRRLPNKVFKISPRLSKLLLPENNVYVPKRRPLLTSDTLKTLMLSRNRISNVYKWTFVKLPALEVLYLDGNNLKYILPEVFIGNDNLQYLHLGQNHIVKFPTKDVLPRNLRYYITKDQRVIRPENNDIEV